MVKNDTSPNTAVEKVGGVGREATRDGSAIPVTLVGDGLTQRRVRIIISERLSRKKHAISAAQISLNSTRVADT